ncbi:GOLPH3/VPS74 family protein [Nocardioides currus]|uniref:GPP34 family phosphoprotein n=1 Tax=Nocardioides currus TaxID=2133958 RepID=A0A2R7YY81_9ACTN|nr:GPP34 family phosphoprotein [Nocardioides currus]PUA80956.1 GPP34 family phosphoprotein [Nocardioides currus]
MTLIAEDLLLILLDDDTGTLSHSDKIQPLLGGALLVELALAERIEVAEKTSIWSSAKVAVVEHEPLEDTLFDPLLDQALATIAEKPRTAQDLVNRLGKGAKDLLLERLAERGLVRPVEDKVWGLFPRTTWPAADRTYEDSVRALLQGALVQGLTPTPRTSGLVALLTAVGHAHKVVDRGDVPAKVVKARAKEISEGAWAAKAVKDAVAAAQAAVTAAVVASTTGAAVASS